MQKLPTPEPVAKFRANPPVELVKLSKEVGFCAVESEMATNLPSQQVEIAEDGSVLRRTIPVGMSRVQRDVAPADRELGPVIHGIHIIVCRGR